MEIYNYSPDAKCIRPIDEAKRSKSVRRRERRHRNKPLDPDTLRLIADTKRNMSSRSRANKKMQLIASYTPEDVKARVSAYAEAAKLYSIAISRHSSIWSTIDADLKKIADLNIACKALEKYINNCACAGQTVPDELKILKMYSFQTLQYFDELEILKSINITPGDDIKRASGIYLKCLGKVKKLSNKVDKYKNKVEAFRLKTCAAADHKTRMKLLVKGIKTKVYKTINTWVSNLTSKDVAQLVMDFSGFKDQDIFRIEVPY